MGLSFFLIVSSARFQIWSLPLISFFNRIFYSFGFSFCFDLESFLFFFMVSFVTFLIALYRVFYMDHYNFKKYRFLTLSFFFSMLFLSSRNSFLNFLVGWDGLGISSLCLIIFYPNNTTANNSLITFFFNRLGDLGLLLVFRIFLLDIIFFTYLFENSSFIFLLLVLLCACTKGAQFPLSSWLPAAMSAPTPISAIVHSSTLVTAGIFIFWKMFIYFSYFIVLQLIVFISFGTFLIGGFLANLDLDLKKIVAFSTIRQISMVTFFLGIGFVSISVFHMFNHALFKTLVFCICGFFFIFNSGDQRSIIPGLRVFNYYIFFVLIFRIFIITGFQFSSSFWTKDVVLECLNDLNSEFFFLFMLLGSLLTLFYCFYILKCIFTPVFSMKSSYLTLKFFSWKFIILICLVRLILGLFFSKIFIVRCTPRVRRRVIALILLIMSYPFIFNKPFNFNFIYLNLDLIFSKIFFFSKLNFVVLLDRKSFFVRDQMIFKPHIIFQKKIFCGIRAPRLGFFLLFLLSIWFYF